MLLRTLLRATPDIRGNALNKLFAALLLAGLTFSIPISAHAAGKPSRFSQATATSQEIGDRYFAAYIARNWDAIEPLIADNASFQDGTAELVFGGVLRQGKPAMMKLFREGYANVQYMRFERARSFYSSNYAIYEGTLDWALDMGDGQIVKTKMPFTTILRIENGKVTKHRDYADYRPFTAAVKAMRESDKRG